VAYLVKDCPRGCGAVFEGERRDLLLKLRVHVCGEVPLIGGK
jgi:hypothetical protein